jgi:uncharacterized protein (TIGR00255 family)
MIRSMTGFGSASIDSDDASVEVEVRSVNSRHLRVNVSVPRGGDEWEPGIRELAGERVERGQLNLAVRVEGAESAPSMELDEDRVEAYLRAFRRLREEYNLPGQVDLSQMVRAGGLLRERRTMAAERVEEDEVLEAAGRALDAMVEMREEEGRRLARDLRERIDALEQGIDRVEELAPRRLERERARLREAVSELVEEYGDRDRDRLDREVALLADKWDLGEELVRARSHLEGFRELLEAPPREAVGKRLKFLVQELHREINTTGAKANDADISREVVEMKNEVERLREQIENVE